MLAPRGKTRSDGVVRPDTARMVEGWSELGLSCQQPFDALAEMLRDPKEDFRTDLAFPLFITRQLALADPKLPGKVLLLRIKAPQFA